MISYEGTDPVMWVILLAALVGMLLDFLLHRTNLFDIFSDDTQDSESEDEETEKTASENTEDSES